MKSTVSSVLFLSLCTAAFGANILYISNIPSPSHFVWCKSLLHSLHERGHNITAVSPDVEKSVERLTYVHLENVYSSFYNGTTEINFLEMGQSSYVAMMFEFMEIGIAACEGTLDSNGYRQILGYPDDFKFDLIIYDFTASQCMLGLVHKFKNTPMVSVSPYLFSGKSTMLSGSLLFPAFFPTPDTAYSQSLNFKERIEMFIMSFAEILVDKYYLLPKMDAVVRKVHPGMSYIDDIEREATKLILLNTQPISDYRQPSLPIVKLVGGAQIRKPKELPAELKAIADNAKNGLVLFSLGTNVRSDALGDERVVKILKAFGRLPKYTFIWKFETKEKLPIDLPKNVHIQSWLPQNDALAHNNTKLFISHCGLLSTQEAFWYGVPVLGFPIFVDQPQNAFRLREKGVSETLSIMDFTEDELYETVKKLLKDPKYRKNMKSISAALHDLPMTAIEEATYWTEWVLRHPEIDLSTPSVDLNLFVRHSFDVYTLLLAIVIFVGYIAAKIIGIVISLCCRKKKLQDKKKLN